MGRPNKSDHETDQRHEANIFRWIAKGQDDQQQSDHGLAHDQPGSASPDAQKWYVSSAAKHGRPEIFERVTQRDQREHTDRVCVDAFLSEPGRQDTNHRAIWYAGSK